jgi:hypothetical protein
MLYLEKHTWTGDGLSSTSVLILDLQKRSPDELLEECLYFIYDTL